MKPLKSKSLEHRSFLRLVGSPFDKKIAERGNTLVSTMIAIAMLSTMVYIYSSAAKQTYQASREVDTKNMYTKVYTILSSEMLEQISNFIFGPLNCTNLGSSAEAGQISSVPSFMATAGFRPSGEERVISGFVLSRDETEFQSGPSGGDFVGPSTTVIDPNLIPNVRYRTAYNFCKNNLNETIKATDSKSFKFCVYFHPQLEDADLHPYLPMFSIVNVEFWNFDSNSNPTCSTFRTNADSADRSVRQSVGARVSFELFWSGRAGTTYGYYTGNYLLTVPKDHIIFKTSKCYRPITPSGSNRGWNRNNTGSDCDNLSFDVIELATNLQGIDGADRICQDLANDIGLANRFKAMMSTSTQDVRDRLSINGRIYTLTGVEVARSATELWMASSSTGGRIVFDESADDYGDTDAETRLTFAGNTTRGRKYSSNASDFCNDWKSTTGNVTRGVARANGTQVYYDNGSTVACNSYRYLMCISQD